MIHIWTRDLQNPAVIIDTNHSNSNKNYLEQIRIAKEVMHNRKHSDDMKKFVKGLMIESYIENGNSHYLNIHMVNLLLIHV